MKGLASLFAVAVMTTLATGGVAAQTEEELDFFGTVVSVNTESGILVVDTATQTGKEVQTDEDTKVKLRDRDGELGDLVVGDVVAVSLRESDLIADKIYLVPGKTSHRHVPGTVTALTEEIEITIQFPGEALDLITFTYDESTPIRLSGPKAELKEGAFVVISATMDQVTGEFEDEALEIHVTSGKQPEKDLGEPEEAAANTADIRGVFKGVDADGNWIVGGRTVTIDPDTQINSGIVAGQLVEIEAELQPDGSLLALVVEAKDRGGKFSGKTVLHGDFEGLD